MRRAALYLVALALGALGLAPPAPALEHTPSRVQIIGQLKGANFNVTTDQPIRINCAAYVVRRFVVTNASTSLTTAAGGVYNAASKGGDALVASSQVYTALTAAAKYKDLTLAAVTGTDVQTASTLYLSLTTAQGSTATADVLVYGDPVYNVPTAPPAGIAVDNVTRQYFSNVETAQMAHTVAGANRYLVVSFSYWHWQRVPLSVTYNGVAMTDLGHSGGAAGDANEQRVSMWGLIAPATGTHNVDVTFSINDPDKCYVTIGAISFTGVNQSTPTGTLVSAIGNGTSNITVTASSATGEMVVDAITWAGGTITVTATGTSRYEWEPSPGPAGSGDQFGAGQTKPGAASVVMNWTASSTTGWSICAVPLKPAP